MLALRKLVGTRRMSSARSLTVTLPDELAEMVRKKVATGEYASESDVVSDGLSALEDRGWSIEDWLRDRVGPTYDRVMSNAGGNLTAAQVRERLKAEARRTSKGA